ncbi:MAG: hypothetical protein FJW34_16725 [Acidobacteria bacterium]|nr:hypothetical protein [Acidobacteriota bacterium]
MAKPEKLDLYKEFKAEYVAPKKPVLVKVSPAKYLTFAGTAKPGGPEFQAAIGALYTMAFTVKMTKKFAGQDYKVCHLEGLYWTPSGEAFSEQATETLEWKLIVRVPDFITARDLKAALAEIQARGKAAEAAQVKLETIREGRCVQLLHVGPYCDELPTIARMAAFAEEQGLKMKGPHHEIYLSDPRRVAPEKLRTILRYPVK